MTHSVVLAAATMLAIASTGAIAEAFVPADWKQLLDASAQQFDDPYRDLAPRQMSDLMSLVRLRNALGGEALGIEEREQLEVRAVELERALRAAGIDVEWLLSQRWAVANRRRQAAVAVNRSLDGQSVEIAGFLVSSPPVDSGLVTSYLMPDRSVCNHLPPPQPNQLLRLAVKDVPETVGFCTPVVVRGTLLAKDTRHEVFVIDDSVSMWSAWTLETEAVRFMSSSTPDKTSLR